MFNKEKNRNKIIYDIFAVVFEQICRLLSFQLYLKAANKTPTVALKGQDISLFQTV